MDQNTITIIAGGVSISISSLLLWAALRESKRQQEQERQARALREKARDEYWHDMQRQMNAVDADWAEA